MTNQTSKYFQTIFAAALLTGCCFIYSCENDPRKIKELTEKQPMIEEGKTIDSYLSQKNVVKARLRSPLMYRYSTDTIYTEFPKSLHVDFYDDSAKVQTWLDSKYGKYFESQDKVYLRDSVVVINIKGDTLKTPDLWWDQKTALFYTDKYAEYHQKDKHIYGGKGLVATQDLKSITFKYPTGTVQVNEAGMAK
jgi:LPS export ABC transporter protein LptC